MGTMIIMHVESGPEIGLGHLRRSTAIRDEVRKRGYLCEFAGHVGEDVAPSLVVIDVPDPDPYLIDAKAAGHRTVQLDAHSGQHEADLTIELVGQYAIIRDAIRTQTPTSTREVVVCVGGADPRGLSGEAARRAYKATARTTLVLGPHTKRPDKLPPGLDVVRTPEDLPERMARCDWAVVNGGTMLCEMMYLGKPVVVLPQNRAEMIEAVKWDQRGAILGVGMDAIKRPSNARKKAVGAKARTTVDGRGVERIAELLIERSQQYWT